MRNSKIILAKNIKVDRNYKNVLNYSESDMLALVNNVSNKVGESNFNSFIRQNGNSIPTNFSYSDALSANYIAFQNPDYSNKWFFAWIDEIVYKNDANIEIKYTIDAWSTWFSKLNLSDCFIVREHVSDDTIGLHTIQENLDVGEVVEEDMFEDSEYDCSENGFYVAIQSNWTITDNSTASITTFGAGYQFEGIAVYNAVVNGSNIFLFPINDISDFGNVLLFLARTNIDGHINDINNMFIVPTFGVDTTKLEPIHTAYITPPWSSTQVSFSWYTMTYSLNAKLFTSTVSKQHTFTNLNVKNNKCFVYPYNYLYVTNNNGSSNIYKYEDFSTDDMYFVNQFCITIGGSGRLTPGYYKGMTTNDDESLPLGKYPTCAWSSDAFTNWLTQNSVNIATQMVTTGVGIALAGATGGASIPVMSDLSAMTGEEQKQALNQYSTGINTASNIAGIIGQFYQASLLPNIQGGQATGDVIFSVDKNRFTFHKMRVKDEYMTILDNYFSRFRL